MGVMDTTITPVYQSEAVVLRVEEKRQVPSLVAEAKPWRLSATWQVLPQTAVVEII